MLARNAICYRKSQMSEIVEAGRARVGVDVGGTFTDVILHEAGGPRPRAQAPLDPADV